MDTSFMRVHETHHQRFQRQGLPVMRSDEPTSRSRSSTVATPCVGFRPTCAVVLIPSKSEFKDAQCDLWWRKEDYLQFQREACSDLRLQCAIKSISVKEAKKLLYQPSQDEVADSELSCLKGSSCSEDEADANKWLHPLSKKYFSNTTLVMSHETSDICESKLPTHPSPVTKQVATPSLNVSYENLVSLDSCSDDTIDNAHWNLNLCVEVKQPVPLRECESTNKRNHSANSGIMSSQTKGLMAICGIFSFALPVVGYFVMNHHFSFFGFGGEY